VTLSSQKISILAMHRSFPSVNAAIYISGLLDFVIVDQYAGIYLGFLERFYRYPTGLESNLFHQKISQSDITSHFGACFCTASCTGPYGFRYPDYIWRSVISANCRLERTNRIFRNIPPYHPLCCLVHFSVFGIFAFALSGFPQKRRLLPGYAGGCVYRVLLDFVIEKGSGRCAPVYFIS